MADVEAKSIVKQVKKAFVPVLIVTLIIAFVPFLRDLVGKAEAKGDEMLKKKQ